MAPEPCRVGQAQGLRLSSWVSWEGNFVAVGIPEKGERAMEILRGLLSLVLLRPCSRWTCRHVARSVRMMKEPVFVGCPSGPAQALLQKMQ